VEPAGAPAVPNERETLLNNEDSRAVKDSPTPETPTVVVDSPGATAPLVMLKRSQHTRATPSFLQDFFLNLVDTHTIL